MKRVLLTSFALAFLVVACVTSEQKLEKEGFSGWRKQENKNVKKLGGTMLSSYDSRTKANCTVVSLPNGKLLISSNVINSDGHYHFFGIIEQVIEKDGFNKGKARPIIKHRPVEIEMKPHGLWIQTLDTTTKMFEQYCPKTILLQLPLEFQNLFRGFFGVGEGTNI